jgi:hypothetical protein
MTGAKGEHARTLHCTTLAYVCESMGTAGVSSDGGYGNTSKTYLRVLFTKTSYLVADDERHLQCIIPDMMVDGSFSPGIFAHCIHRNLVSGDNERHLQGIIPGMMVDGLLPPGQSPNNLDGCWQLVELKTLSQRGMSVDSRAERIQRDAEKRAKDLDVRDPRNTVYAELVSNGIKEQYVALVVGCFGESSKYFIKLRDYLFFRKPTRTSSASPPQ